MTALLLVLALLLPGDWVRTFHDTFTGDHLRSHWTHRGQEQIPGQMTYARGSSRGVKVRSGAAHFRVLVDPNNRGHYLNGHIGTEGAFEATHGYAEARIRFHTLKGAHGAFWLLTPDVYIPEIDVAEAFGAKRVWHNFYWGDGRAPKSIKKSTRVNVSRAHDYGVLWTPTTCRYLIDDVQVATTRCDSAPKFLVLSLLTKDFEISRLDLNRLEDYRMTVYRVSFWERR